MKKFLKEEWLCYLKKNIEECGYLSKKDIIHLSKKYKINYKLFCKLLKENKIPFRDKNLFNILNAYNIFSNSNKKISLEDFNNLGNWKLDVFKNSKIKANFLCKECGNESKSDLRKLINRTYYKLEPICSKCICKIITKNDIWINNNKTSKKICKNTKESIEAHKKNMKKYWSDEKNRVNMSNIMKEKWKNDEYKKNVVEGYFKKYGVKMLCKEQKFLKKV